MRLQIIESANFVIRNLPTFDSPEEIFYYLKKHTQYVSDPKGIELFQGTKTLFFENYHDTPGAGDCDCFTITALAFLLASNFNNCGAVLVGRSRKTAVHIYAYVIIDGNIQYLDLTNKVFNFERSYPYKQLIPFRQ